jgi:DNA-binding transcriptional LysR family regulator
MSQLEDMRILLEVMDQGGFSAAARRLGLTTQLVSRRVMRLEERLGVQLLTRTTRRLTPTDLGRDYVERSRRILAEVEEAELALSSHLVEPRGRLRVSAPVSFGLSHLASIVHRFSALHPKVELDLDLSDRPVDIVAEGFDMAVRIGRLPDSSLIARKLADVRFTVVASPDYLARRGEPVELDDLRSHDCLMFKHSRGEVWFFRVDGVDQTLNVSGPLRANNGDILRDAAIAGLGITQLPDFLTAPAISDGRLVSLMGRLLPPGGAVYAVHAAHRQRSLPVRAFTDYLIAALK